MPTVYVDPSVLLLDVRRGPRMTETALVPGAADALRHLTEASCPVTVVGLAPEDARLVPAGVDVAPRLPGRLGPDAWFLTGDPYTKLGRPSGARTVLVGPKRSPGPIPLPRYDLEARDLPSAVMEILTHVAMA